MLVIHAFVVSLADTARSLRVSWYRNPEGAIRLTVRTVDTPSGDMPMTWDIYIPPTAALHSDEAKLAAARLYEQCLKALCGSADRIDPSDLQAWCDLCARMVMRAASAKS